MPYVDHGDEKRSQFGEWLAMDEDHRARVGLPRSQNKMAEHLGVNPKTLSRWRQGDPVVAEAYTRALALRGTVGVEVEASAVPSGEASSGDALSESALSEQDRAAQEFEAIRQEMVSRARKSDKGLETYMRYFGKHLLEQELQARESGFADLSDTELVDTVLGMIGPDAVRAWLDRREASGG